MGSPKTINIYNLVIIGLIIIIENSNADGKCSLSLNVNKNLSNFRSYV